MLWIVIAKTIHGAEFIPVSRPHLWGSEAKYVNEALSAGWISSRGKFVDAFERTFAELLPIRHGVAVCNGTAAVQLALTVLDIAPGDEVIIPDFCMIAPVLAILQRGAIPVPVDVDATWNMDPAAVEARISKRTRAILVVHNYGHPAEMNQLTELANRYNLLLVEDAAEALGASVRGRMAGTFGVLSTFSFYANKVITTGEGGMVVTDDSALCERTRWMRDLCFGHDEETRYTHQEIGYNFRLTNLQAAIGVAQLEHFAEAVAAKIAIGEEYNHLLQGIEGLTLPPQAAWAQNSYWVYGIVVERDFGVTRAELQQKLRERKIETRRFFTPVHQQPIIKQAAESSAYAHSCHLAEHGLYLPSYIGMTSDVIARVAETIRDIQQQHYGR